MPGSSPAAGAAGGLRRNHDRGVLLTLVVPALGARLGIEVNDSGREPGALGGAGKVEGEGGFPGAAFLRDDCKCLHVVM